MIPYYFGNSSLLNISDLSFKIFLLSCNAIAFIQIQSLLVEAYVLRKSINDTLQSKDYEKILQHKEVNIKWPIEKLKIEQKILNYNLQSIGLIPDYEDNKLKFVTWDSTILIQPILMAYPLISESGSSHMNIFIPFFGSDIEYREYIFFYSRKVFNQIGDSKTDIKHFTLSYFNKLPGGHTDHLSMIRAKLKSIADSKNLQITDEEYIKRLDGIFFADKIAKF